MSVTSDITPPSPAFATTCWTMVVALQKSGNSQARSAWDELARRYWYPIYAYVRKRGHSVHDAQDLTQEFFSRLLERDYLQAASREKGRFRTFLRVMIDRFLINEWKRNHAARRGGLREVFSIDAEQAEARYRLEPTDGMSPEIIYERRWALTLLEQAMVCLKNEYEGGGRVREFEVLKKHLTAARGTVDYVALSGVLEMTEGAARVALHRLRKRLRECFRTVVVDTLGENEDVETELRHVVGLLGNL